MNIDAKAREIVASDEWDIELLLTTIQSRSLTKAIAAALLAVRNEALEEAAKVAAAIRNSELEVPAARQAAMTIEDRIRALKTTTG